MRTALSCVKLGLEGCCVWQQVELRRSQKGLSVTGDRRSLPTRTWVRREGRHNGEEEADTLKARRCATQMQVSSPLLLECPGICLSFRDTHPTPSPSQPLHLLAELLA